MYYGRMALKDSQKSVSPTYIKGAALFMLVAAAMFTKAHSFAHRDKVEVVRTFFEIQLSFGGETTGPARQTIV